MISSTKALSSRYRSRDTVCPCRSHFGLFAQVSADTETGPGVYETALAYTDALRMADNAILFKFLAKSIGIKRGVIPSFMAKPWGNVSNLLVNRLNEYLISRSSPVAVGMSQSKLVGNSFVDSSRPKAYTRIIA